MDEKQAGQELYIMTPAERKSAKRATRRARRAARRPLQASLRAHLSIFYLSVRRRGGAVAILLAATVALEAVLFAVGLSGEVSKLHTLPGPMTFGRLLEESGMLLPFLPAFVLLSALLAGLAPAGTSKTDLTIRCLRIGEGAYYLWQAAFAAVCYLSLAAVQVLAVFIAGHVYLSALGGEGLVGVSDMALLSVFYDNILLHGLLPLADSTRWVATGFILAGLSVAVAHAEYGRWHRRGRPAAAIATVVLVALYPHDMGTPGQDLIITLPVAAIFGYFMIRRWFREETE